MTATTGVRTALVHDWLNQDGGAEAVLGVLHGLYPDAPVYTTMADADRVPSVRDWPVRVTWLDRLPGIHGRHQPYLPLYPVAWSRTRLHGYDLVLSNKSAFCHGVRADGATHVCYCLTPTRFVWEPDAYLAFEDVPPGTRLVLSGLLPWLRRWDRRAADRVDAFVAISGVVRDRIARYYGRESVVIHPPVDVDGAGATSSGDPTSEHGAAKALGGTLRGKGPRAGTGPPSADGFYIVLARLVPYKRIDLAVEAFNRLGRRLVVVGDGRDRDRLARLAGPTVELRGRLPREEVAHLLVRCRGVVWPGVEDFGLVPVEAMAAGRPVVARRAGGVLDTVLEGETGVFFDDATPDALAEAVTRADAIDWAPARIRAHAARFGRHVFEDKLTAFVEERLAAAREAPTDRDAAAAASGPGR